jgi:hypothetical protein
MTTALTAFPSLVALHEFLCSFQVGEKMPLHPTFSTPRVKSSVKDVSAGHSHIGTKQTTELTKEKD